MPIRLLMVSALLVLLLLVAHTGFFLHRKTLFTAFTASLISLNVSSDPGQTLINT